MKSWGAVPLGVCNQYVTVPDFFSQLHASGAPWTSPLQDWRGSWTWVWPPRSPGMLAMLLGLASLSPGSLAMAGRFCKRQTYQDRGGGWGGWGCFGGGTGGVSRVCVQKCGGVLKSPGVTKGDLAPLGHH